MRLDKIKNTFNDYKLELSWGQLEAVRGALEADHADPVKDEMLAEFDWYMDRVPGPGEEEEEVKQREQMGMPAGGEGAAPGEEGQPGVEMPPSEGAADMGQGPQPPPEEMPGAEGQEGQPGQEGLPPQGAGEQAPEEGELPPPTEGEPPSEEADQHLPAPPAE